MDKNNQERSQDGEVSFEKKVIIKFNDGSPFVEEHWTNEGGVQKGAKSLRVFDTVGQLVSLQYVDGFGGRVFGSKFDNSISKKEHGLPVEVIQVEVLGSPLSQAIDGLINQDGHNTPIQLETNKINFYWNFENKQLVRVLRSHVVEYGRDQNIYKPQSEDHFSYDLNGRLLKKRSVYFYSNDEVETAALDEYEYKKVGDLIYVTQKNFKNQSKGLNLSGVEVWIYDSQKKVQGHGWYYNSPNGGYLDEKFGDTLELHFPPKPGDLAHMLPKKIKVDSFAPKV